MKRRDQRGARLDEGGRYCGEWAIGVNNRVRHPMLDTLFDEKIGGSFHLTPGNAYEIADNGNRSRIHWDLVQIQRPDYGGGEIWFDGKLVRKDGRFLPNELQDSTKVSNCRRCTTGFECDDKQARKQRLRSQMAFVVVASAKRNAGRALRA